MAAQRLVWRFSSFPLALVKAEHRPPSTTLRKQMSTPLKTPASAAASTQVTRKLPIVLFDVLDTIVRDPFYHDVPAFFGMSMKELLECKDPTAWIDFEKGLIDEMELARTFFKDGRPIDLEGLKNCMRRGYSYLEGVEELLIDLKKNGYEMHTATNYPSWYEIIEEKLKLSTYLSWTFCSCTMGKRKPDPDFFMDILKTLNVEPECCVFIDDRMRNVEAARHAGLIAIQFQTAHSLQHHLSRLGFLITPSHPLT
ncbi:hypothetical protein ACS0TY_001973 [Phlomoides rotata]